MGILYAIFILDTPIEQSSIAIEKSIDDETEEEFHQLAMELLFITVKFFNLIYRSIASSGTATNEWRRWFSCIFPTSPSSGRSILLGSNLGLVSCLDILLVARKIYKLHMKKLRNCPDKVV